MLFGKQPAWHACGRGSLVPLHSPSVQHKLRFWKQLQGVVGE